MSPLVRSLLALAALFATAATLTFPPPWSCTEKTFGQVTQNSIPLMPVTLPPPGGRIDIKDFCPKGYRRVGETVLACNNDPNGQPPLVYLTNPPDLRYVDVVCTDGCPAGVTVTITEYCAPDPFPAPMESSLKVVPLAQGPRRN